MKHITKLIVLLLILTAAAACSESNGKYKELSDKNGIISIPLSEINDGSAHYFSVNSGGRNIKFFVLKSNDGVIRAAFDACDVCYPEQKGYRQDGQFMICNNCGQKFHSSRINVVKGGCNPSPLKREEQGSNLIITMNDIATGARYF